MCGITGIAVHPDVFKSPTERKLLVAMYQVLLASIENRGHHATGSVAITPQSEYHLHRKAETFSKVVKTDEWQKHIEGIPEDSCVLMGHTRHGTHGTNVDENAHPFVMGNVIGCHNGIIYNYRDIAKDVLKVEPWPVDSQAIFALLDARTADGAHYRYGPSGALALLDGYFAVSWWKDGKFYLAKSESAQLACAYIKPLKTLVWNSEMNNLKSALKEGGFDDRQVDLWRPETDQVYEFNVNAFNDLSSSRTVYQGNFSKSRRNQFNGARPDQSYYTGGNRQRSENYQPQTYADWKRQNDYALSGQRGGQTKSTTLSLREIMEEAESATQMAQAALSQAQTAMKIANAACEISGIANQRMWSIKHAVVRICGWLLGRGGKDVKIIGEVEHDLDATFRSGSKTLDRVYYDNGGGDAGGHSGPVGEIRGYHVYDGKRGMVFVPVNADNSATGPGLLPETASLEAAQEKGAETLDSPAAVDETCDPCQSFSQLTDEERLRAIVEADDEFPKVDLPQAEEPKGKKQKSKFRIDKCAACQKDDLQKGKLVPLVGVKGQVIHEGCKVPMEWY